MKNIRSSCSHCGAERWDQRTAKKKKKEKKTRKKKKEEKKKKTTLKQNPPKHKKPREGIPLLSQIISS